MLESAILGLQAAVQWPAIGFLFLGIVLGIYFGAVPGLSGLSGMAILLPFTFGMEPISAFSFLLGMYAVTTTADSLTAILIGVPGTAAAQATVLDGYPMAKRGEAARAFGAAFTCSMIGGVIGAVCMGLSIPIVQPIVLAFAKPEFFMLGLLGLTMVGSLSGNSVLKGVTVAGLGLLLSQIGYAEQVAIPRYWLNQTYLLEHLPLVPVVLGLFALPEVVSLSVSAGAISAIPRERVAGGVMAGVRDAFTHWWLLLKSSLIGVYIGLLPALGSTIADWIAYGHAVQSAKDKSQFGKGDVRGVIAPEAANNSCKGGELVPTVAFGIPGSAPMAILLGAFLVQGLTPGPEMLTTKLSITYSLMWTLIIANVTAALFLLAWGNQLQRIIFIPAHLVVPGITLFMLMGAWTANNHIGDWITVLVFGVVGVVMKTAGWPRAPLVLGFILGRIMENSLHISIRAYGYYEWLFRPVCLVLALAIIVTIIFAIRSHRQMKAQSEAALATAPASEPESADTRVSLGFGVLIAALFAYAIVEAQQWPLSVKLFPLVFAVPALALALFAIGADFATLRRRSASGLGAPPGPGAADNPTAAEAMAVEIGKSVRFLAWIVGIFLLTVVAGQHIALPVMIAVYLLVWGRYSLALATVYALAGLAVMIGVFDYMSPTVWYPALWDWRTVLPG